MPSPTAKVDESVRPGSMTAAMKAAYDAPGGPRWLRWAIVRDGRVEEEHTIPPDTPLRIGGDSIADSVVPAPRRRTTLFAYAAGAWVLHATEGIEGRTERGDLGELTSGGKIDLRLGDTSRARIALGGGASLLIQVVERPIVKAPRSLPALVQGGVLHNADWRFTSFVAASVFLHLGLVAFLMEADWPVESYEPPAALIAQTIFPPPPPPSRPPVIDPPQRVDSDEGEPADGDGPFEAPPDRSRRVDARRSRSDSSPSESGRPDADGRARQAVQDVIGTLSGVGGAFNSVRDGYSYGDAARTMAQAGGVDVASASPGMIDERDGRERVARGEGIGGLRRRSGSGGPVREGEALEEVVVSLPSPPPIHGLPESSDVTDTYSEIIMALRRRMPAVRRCYENVLTHGDPEASGRILIEMQVMPPGHVAGVRAAENSTGSDSLAACVVRAVRTVRVRNGPESPVHVEFPIVLARQR